MQSNRASTLPASASSATLGSSASSHSLNPPVGTSLHASNLQLASNAAASAFSTEFPFGFLHIEMIRHFRERDAELRKEKEQWLQRVKESESEGGGTDEQKIGALADAFSKQIFAADNCETRLEAIGYRVGLVLVERVARPLPRLTSELEIMKFLCKDFWSTVFGRGVDNLKTNHQGVYTMQDNRFSTLVPLADGQQYLKEAVVFLAMPAGIVRGALATLGLDGVVTATVERLPVVVFKVELHRQGSS